MQTSHRTTRKKFRWTKKVTAILLAFVFLVGTITTIAIIEIPPPVEDGAGSLNDFSIKDRTGSDGATYVFDRNVTLYLLLGTDSKTTITGDFDQNSQSDVVLVLAVDDYKEEVRILQLDRDTICSVDFCGPTGIKIDFVDEQLALAFAHGGSKPVFRAQNVKRSVNRLLDLRLDNYALLTMGGIESAIDAAGGKIKITLPEGETFSEFEGDRESEPGKLILTTEQTAAFLTARKDVEDGTNRSRMFRHQLMIDGICEAMYKSIGTDVESLTNAWNRVKGYSLSNCDNLELAQLTANLMTYKRTIFTPEGTTFYPENVNEFARFTVDESSLNDMIIQLCYKKKGD